MPSPGRSRFRPRLVATAATVLAVAAFVSLGQWQLERAAEKRALREDFAREGPALELRQLADDAPRYQRVAARGRYDAERQFLIDNRVHAGQPGVHVLTPLVLADGSALLVNRGWLPFDRGRGLPGLAVDTEARALTGRIDALPRSPIELPAEPAAGWPKLVQYPRMGELAAMVDRKLHPRIVLLDAWEPDGYLREWTPPGSPPARNLAYAVQWFAFAAVAIALWIVLGRTRPEDGR